MAISDFDFRSPGTQFREVDESTTPEATGDPGITIIGTAPAGPGMIPTRITSIEQLDKVFGEPNDGQQASADSDVYRDGNSQLPNYGLYAARAWLAQGTGGPPVNFVRLLGQDASNQGTDYVKAGWNNGGANLSTSVNMNNGAYGLFIMPSGSHNAATVGTNVPTGSLAAVIYTTASAVTINGIAVDTAAQTSSAGQFIHSVENATSTTFKLEFWSDNGTAIETKTINLTPNTDGYIRDVLNTNPQKVNSINYATTEKYFLGETYEESVRRHMDGHSKGYGIILPLELASSDATNNLMNHLGEAVAPKTGWIINRDPNPTVNPEDYDVSNMSKLFKIHSLHEGEWMHGYHIKIADLVFGTTVNPNCSFTIQVQRGNTTVEKFANLNLDPTSENYVARRIGTSFQTWDSTYKVFDDEGRYRSRSAYIRIEESEGLKNGSITDSYRIPWGFYGPAKPKPFTITYGSSGANAVTDYDQNTGGTKSTQNITYSDTMSAGDDLIFTHPELGNFTISFIAGSGADPTSFTNQAASITVGDTNHRELIAASVAALLNSIEDYNASAAAEVVTVTADVAGPFFNVALSETTDSNNRQAFGTLTAGVDGDNVTNVFVKGGNTMPQSANAVDTDRFARMPQYLTASFDFPRLKLTEQNTKESANYTQNDDFGVRHAFATDSEVNDAGVMKRKDYLDLVRKQVYDVHADAGDNLEYSFIFSLDDVVSDAGEPDSPDIARWYWQSGSHSTPFEVASLGYIAYTAQSGSKKLTKNGPTSFNVPLFGGSDGLDITLVDPFSNSNVLNGKAINTHYAYHSVDKALDMIKDPEKLRSSIISYPGLTNSKLIKKVVNVAEDRGDCLAIIDYDDGYRETYENSGTRIRSSVNTVIDNSETLLIDSSKAAAYYPRVEISSDGFAFTAPASVGAIGALAFSDANSAGPWFAPAGFNRGGLSILGGRDSGLAVLSTDKNLTKKNRDDLYLEHINPIARFPAANNNVVIFGQKTLLKSKPTSALSRVNVRRLMIFLRQRIGDIADTVLFEQNVASTFNNFALRCEAVLNDVKSNFGITEYKIVRVTQTLEGGVAVDLADRNIMYVRIFIKPARSIEFIAIDFVVSRSNAEF